MMCGEAVKNKAVSASSAKRMPTNWSYKADRAGSAKLSENDPYFHMKISLVDDWV